MSRSLTNDVDKTRVFLLSGFLGSGKTTLINQIIKFDKDLSGLVIIVNEFGKLGIDKCLIEYQDKNVIEMTSGCICCSMAVDLKQRLLEIHQNYEARLVLIEPSGVAEPSGICNVLADPNISTIFQLEKIITILDAKCWQMRNVFGQLFVKQLEIADLILLNKIDLIKQDIVHEMLREIRQQFSEAHVIPTLQCRIDQELIIEDKETKKSQLTYKLVNELITSYCSFNSQDNKLSETSGATPKFTSLVYHTSEVINEKKFNEFIDRLPIEIFRIKGPVCFSKKTVLLNYVSGQKNWAEWNGSQETHLAIIGWEMDNDSLINSLDYCKLE